MERVRPIDVSGLFSEINDELGRLLRGLRPEDWRTPTVCAGWSVKDIAAHLLDSNIRKLSFERDGHPPPAPPHPIRGYPDLVVFLNGLNADWVSAFRRVSPELLIEMLVSTGEQLAAHVASLDPEADSLFPVAWAGEERSANWFDTAREYTEKWHHQQQIRDAVGAEPLANRRFLHPVLDTFLRALPFRYRETAAPSGATVTIRVTGPAGGDWTLLRSDGKWLLHTGLSRQPAASIDIPQDAAWRLLTKGLAPAEAKKRSEVFGPESLTAPFFDTLSVMA